MTSGLAIFSAGGLAILIAGGLALFSAGRLAIFTAGGRCLGAGTGFAAGGGGLGGAADDGRLVLARGRKLSRHRRRIPSLQHSPLVSGRSTGRWELAPCQNRERMVASSNAVAAASPQNSREYSGKGRSRWARAMKRAAISIAAGARKTGNKKLFKTGGKTKTGGNGAEVTVRSSLLSQSTLEKGTRRRRAS